MTQRLVYRIILPVGRAGRPIPDKVSRKVTYLLRPWLSEALERGQALPLPFPAAAGFRAAAEQRPEGLVVHLSRPFEDGADTAAPVATIGVAARAAQLPALRHYLSRLTSVICPMPAGAPCCIVIPDVQRQPQFPEMEEWLEEFADGVARAWLDLRDGGPVNPPGAGIEFPKASSSGAMAAQALEPSARVTDSVLRRMRRKRA